MSDPETARVELTDHERPDRPGEVVIGRTDPESSLTVTVVLRQAADSAQRGADLAALQEFASGHNLQMQVQPASEQGDFVLLFARAADFEAAFQCQLEDVERGGRRYRRFTQTPSLRPELRDALIGIFGLRGRPLRPKPRIHHPGTIEPFWTVSDLERAYDFPNAVDGTGQVIALIELGGGYNEQDVRTFFSRRGQNMPQLTFKSIGGALNQPCSADGIQQWMDVIEGKRQESDCNPDVLEAAQTTAEVTMDIEIAGALAPGVQIVVYMAPATEDGIYQALSAAVYDEQPHVDVISMSWGEPETYVSEAHFNAISHVLEDASQKGITVCTSSGDTGAFDDPQSKTPCVNFPASSPWVLACGGSTVLRCEVEIQQEVAWNCGPHGIQAATGGGVSGRFPLPAWQDAKRVPVPSGSAAGRGVPDVAAVADPHNGCEILVGGLRCSSFGTSAVAPLWAALIVRCNQALKLRCGYINPVLYQLAASGTTPFRSITEGDNGLYSAGAGWNACTGLGTPKGHALLEALRGALVTAKH